MHSIERQLRLHSLDEQCRCRRCAEVRDRPRTHSECEAEEGVDTFFGIWWNYQEVEVSVQACRRCGLVIRRERTGHVRGIE